MESSNPRAVLEALIRDHGDDFASISRMLGKNAAYIQQFVRRGTPKKLDEADRSRLADYYGIDEARLGGPACAAVERMIPIRQLDVGPSAGHGASAVDERPVGEIGFGAAWLRRLGVAPESLSLVTVAGDSMEPTLSDGDDIMVDHGAAEAPLRDGVHVLRIDGDLLVKRLARAPGGKLSVRSDNAHYPSWDALDPAAVEIVGRVVWAGRRL